MNKTRTYTEPNVKIFDARIRQLCACNGSSASTGQIDIRRPTPLRLEERAFEAHYAPFDQEQVVCVARPREFDREGALRAATETFWSRGFDGVGMEELTVAMGIGRQSLYAAFGNKKALYLEALQAYNAGNVTALITALREARSPLTGLRIVLLTPIDLDPAERAKGCFGINAICEFGQSDPDVLAANSMAGASLHKALVALVRTAQEKGEVKRDLDPKIAVGFIQTLLSGVKIAARAGSDPRSMRKIVDLALGALTA